MPNFQSGVVLGEISSASIEAHITQTGVIGGGLSVPNSVVEYDKHYEHNQRTAASVWNIEHDMNKFPSVSIVDSGGNVVIGEIKYLDKNNLTVTFTAQFAGKAYCN